MRPLLLGLAWVLLTTTPARAADECETDADCVALYADGFVCADGSLGRYCVERGCDSDSDCRDEYGEDSWCESWGGPESRCSVPDPPAYVPPFHSMCSVGAAAGGSPDTAWALALAAVLLARRRARHS